MEPYSESRHARACPGAQSLAALKQKKVDWNGKKGRRRKRTAVRLEGYCTGMTEQTTTNHFFKWFRKSLMNKFGAFILGKASQD